MTAPTDPDTYTRHYAHVCRWCGTRLKAGVCPVCGDENEVETKEGESHE